MSDDVIRGMLKSAGLGDVDPRAVNPSADVHAMLNAVRFDMCERILSIAAGELVKQPE